jgi:hypothetical protein
LSKRLEGGIDRRLTQAGPLQKPGGHLLVRLLVVHHQGVGIVGDVGSQQRPDRPKFRQVVRPLEPNPAQRHGDGIGCRRDAVPRVEAVSVGGMDAAGTGRPVQPSSVLGVRIQQCGGGVLAAHVAQRIGGVPSPLGVLQQPDESLDGLRVAQASQRADRGLDPQLGGKLRFVLAFKPGSDGANHVAGGPFATQGAQRAHRTLDLVIAFRCRRRRRRADLDLQQRRGIRGIAGGQRVDSNVTRRARRKCHDLRGGRLPFFAGHFDELAVLRANLDRKLGHGERQVLVHDHAPRGVLFAKIDRTGLRERFTLGHPDRAQASVGDRWCVRRLAQRAAADVARGDFHRPVGSEVLAVVARYLAQQRQHVGRDLARRQQRDPSSPCGGLLVPHVARGQRIEGKLHAG